MHLQSAVLRSRVVCLSVRPSVTLVDCDHTGWNSSEIISPLVSLECSLSADLNIRGLLQGEHLEILTQWATRMLIWASVTFDRKLRPNGYKQRNGQNGEPIGNHHRSFEWCNRWPPTTFLPQNGGSIHFMFGSRVGFSASADRMALFQIQVGDRPPSWIISNGHNLRNVSFDPLI